MAKKKDASTGSADASVLRRSGRETSSRKQTTTSPLSSKKSERVNKHTSPSPSPVRNKLEKVERQIGSSPLRRSDRGKKLVEMPSLPNIRSTNEKTANNPEHSSEDVNEDEKSEKQNRVIGDRKRKRFTALSYKATFKPQRIRIESDDDENLEPEENGGNVLPSNGDIANNDNHSSHPSSYMIELNIENQKELDTCHKVTGSHKVAGITENAENNNVSSNMQNSKFVEFWVPVQLSNVQLEQYCATLLSSDIALRSSSKSDALGTLKEILTTNRKCCNHPYTVDRKIQQSLIKEDKDPSMVLDVDIEASGKLQFLDHILPEIKERQLKVLILYQLTSGASSGALSLGHILGEFVLRRLGQNSYEHVDGVSNVSSKKQAAINMFNKDMTKFIFLLESHARRQSIKFSSMDAIIIFDSELNPFNDLKSLQKLFIDSQSEQIMIFRLYSAHTLEEKILNLAENKMALDFRSQNLRSNYDALLTWGASDLFDKLTKFHNQTVLSISSEESFLKDVVEEFLYLLSHKCKSNDKTSKSIISQVQSCEIHGKNTMLRSEIKTHLPDGDQPYIFWKKLLEGQSPVWKFVCVSTPRQRKRTLQFLEGNSGEDDGGVRTRRKIVNNSNVEPAQLKTVTNGKTGGVNEGVSSATESQSLSGDQFWSVTVNDETSVLDLLKPTVFELCNFLKFSEDVKIIVERFLEYVVENYDVSKVHTSSKEHKSTLPAFMISLCWIGSSLAKNKIDRSESFALAKKHFDYSCDKEKAESVYKRLKQVKKRFLERTQIRPAIKDCVSAPEGVELGTERSQRITDVDVSNENVSRKGANTFEKINRDWDEKRASLENDHKVDKAIIHALYNSNPSIRSEKLEIKEREFANKLKELEELKATMLAAAGPVVADNNFSLPRSQHETRVVPSGNPEVAITLPENTIEVQSHDEPVCEGANDIESTGSHTSEKEMVDTTVSSEHIGVPAQQHSDDTEVDVAEKVDSGHENVIGNTSCPLLESEDPVEDHIKTGSNDVAPHVDCGDVEIPAGNDNNENEEDGTIGLDENDHSETCANDLPQRVYSGDVEIPAGNDKENDDGTVGTDENDHNETGANDMAPHRDSGDVGIPAGNDKENDDNGTVGLDETDHNETGANDMAPHRDSGDMGMPAGNYNKENDECGTVSLDKSHVVKDCHKTVDVAQEVESVEMATPAGTCDRESPEEGEIQPDAPDAGGDYNETSPNDVLHYVVSAEMATPSGTCGIESPEEGEIQPDAPCAGGDHNETSPNNELPCVVSAEMATPADNLENAEDSVIRPDALHVNEDHNGSSGSNSSNPVCAAITQEKSPSVPVPSPASDLLKPIIPDSGVQDKDINFSNPQSSGVCQHDQIILDDELDFPASTDPVCAAAISQDTTPPVQPVSSPASDHVEPIFPEIQNDPLQLEQLPDSGVQDKDINFSNPQPSGVSQHDQIILDDELDFPASTDPVCAVAISQDTTPPVQPVSSPASDRVEPILPEIQNDPLQLEQLPDSGVQDEDSNVGNLQPSGDSQLDQIIPDVEPDFPSSTDPAVAENPSDTLLPSEPLLEPTCEEPTLTVPHSVENMEETPVPASEAPHEEQQPLVATSVAPRPLVNELDMFDNLPNRVNPQMLIQDPLQAEVERLKEIKDKVTKLHQEKKQSLNTECDKEIEEAVAQIKLKYEAKHREEDAYYDSKKTKLETNISRVYMNKILAEAFRNKCQDLTPSGHPVASQAGIMQQLNRLPALPSMRHYHGASSSASGQSTGNQQSQQLPPPLPLQQQPQLQSQLPLQIVHQQAALFSNTPSRTPSTTLNRPPSNTSSSTTPSRPPPVVDQMTASTPSTASWQVPTRLPPIVNHVTPTPNTSRPPVVDQMASSTPPTASRQLPTSPSIVNHATPTALTASRPPVVDQITSSTPPTTSRQLPTRQPSIVNQVSPTTPTTSRPPPGTNMSSLLPKRAPSIAQMDMSAANLRINTETRRQSPHLRPMVSREPRPPPHMRPLASSEPRAPAPHLRCKASTEIRTRAPHIQPFRSMPSVSPDIGTNRRVPPSQNVTNGPSQSSVMPPLTTSSPQSLTPQPPPPEPCTVPPSAQTQPSDNLNGLGDNASRWVNVTAPQHDPTSQNEPLDVDDYVREGTAPSSAHDLVCLSDDD